MPSVQLTATDPNVNYGSWVGGSIQTLDVNASATFQAVLVTTGVWRFTATDQGGTYTSDTSTNVVVLPGAPKKLVMLLPNQTLTPGTVGGVRGAALPQTAGTQFNVTIDATDQYSNLVSTGRNGIYVVTSDLYATNPGTFTMTNGQLIITTVTLNTAGGGATSLTAYDNSNNGGPTLTLAVATVTVNAAQASRLQLVLPGEMAVPGNTGLPRGVSSTPTPQLAGQHCPVTLNITDGFWTPVLTATSTIQIVSGDPNNASTGPWTTYGKDPVTITVTTGSYVFQDSLITGSTTTGWAFTATDLTNHSLPLPLHYTTFISSTVPVQANPSNQRLLALLPGESNTPGTATGKSGSVSAYTVGSALNVVTFVTDNFFNIITVPRAAHGISTDRPRFARGRTGGVTFTGQQGQQSLIGWVRLNRHGRRDKGGVMERQRQAMVCQIRSRERPSGRRASRDQAVLEDVRPRGHCNRDWILPIRRPRTGRGIIGISGNDLNRAGRRQNGGPETIGDVQRDGAVLAGQLRRGRTRD